ncbi:MAG: hypothetical protein JWO38_8096 [Gemmataceae bacterium]|nr:hypothetical protein [Gemmataceae bacterium]
MARKFTSSLPMPDGSVIGYKLTPRNGVYTIQFIGPDGKYVRKSTGLRDQNAALIEGSRIIARTFSKGPKPKRGWKSQSPKAKTWDDVIEDLRCGLVVNNNKTATFGDYKKTINTIRRTLPDTVGPEDITPDRADEFKAEYVGGKFKRGHAEDATEYARKHTTLNAYLRKARAIWHKWLKITPNPWDRVENALLDKHKPTAPSEEVIEAFFGWLRKTYGGWELPVCFFSIKAYTGCRLQDLCGLRADQFDGQSLRFDADQTKNREGRTVELPPDVATVLERVKGKGYLWGRYPEGIREHNRGTSGGNRLNLTFDPTALYSWAQRTMKSFKEAHPGKKLSTHAFRRRAVTVAYAGGYSVNEIADMFGMTAQNVEKSYLDKSRANHSAKLKTLAGSLLPKSV